MKYLPTDVSTFSTIITGNYLYIDKTEYIYNLFKGGSRYYFLSRPRRFGKSLLASTLKELFSANKDLFQNLWISSSNYQWEKHPIIYLDFSIISHKNSHELEISLTWALKKIADSYEIDISEAPTLGSKLELLVQKLSETNKVVILVDEYDKPILDHIKNIQESEAQRDVLKSFFDALKGLDAYLRAIFITGVTKFSKTSIFSGINNLNDISLDPIAAKILGYTEKELKNYFFNHINSIAKLEQLPFSEIFKKMTNWYNGYRFSREETKVFNPFSILYFLNKKHLANYWFESGTPTFLVNLIKKQYESIGNIENIEVSNSSLGTFEIDNIPLIPLLFQAGYLTISDYNKETDRFKLNYPNFEVEEAFTKYLVSTLSHTNLLAVDTSALKLIQAINADDIDSFCSILRTLFAHIPYTLHIDKESYYHSLFQFLMSLLSLESQSEILTDIGRIDMALIAKTHVYIFEIKLNIDPKVALQQIKDRRYFERYLCSNKKITLIGLSFKNTNSKLNLNYIKEDL